MNRILKIAKLLIPKAVKETIKKLPRIRSFLQSDGYDHAQYRMLGYPCKAPVLKVEANLDFLVLELPPRYMPLMPNGLGYLYNILLKCNVAFQILDVNICIYHKYHERRLRKNLRNITTPKGYLLPRDPWDNTNTAQWEKDEVISYFWSDISDLVNQITLNPPKALGISLSGFNRNLARKFVKEVRKRIPDIVIIVGGYDCVYHELGPLLFPDFDYMVIGEAELTLKPLVEALAKGKRPKDLPGIISKHDSPNRKWSTLTLENLDEIDWPKYPWAEDDWYQTYDRHHLVPIAGSRGCHWGKCEFCAERFSFRKRSPKEVVNEIEHFTKRGFHSFHFNESDVNGDPQNLHDICSEVTARNLKVQLVGQLRIDRRNTAEYFDHMAKAGFKHLRFGVDGWNDRLLKLMKKGYNMKLVFQNLRDCHRAGIVTNVNMVIGIPGETEEDVDNCIDNFIRCKDFIHTVESFNTLILACGSEYYLNPEKHKIRFRYYKEDIYERYTDYVPTTLWYSEEPYIDQEVRLKRLNRVLEKLSQNGVNIGSFASKVVERLQSRGAESDFRP